MFVGFYKSLANGIIKQIGFRFGESVSGRFEVGSESED